MTGLFLTSLAVFHWTLVWQWPLGKIGWKKVDYIWISLALLGLLAGISESRQTLARGGKNWVAVRIVGSFERLRRDVNIFSNSPILCRKFARSEFSPPPEIFDRVQKEHDEGCAWFTKINETFPKSLDEIKSPIDLSQYPPPPSNSNPVVENSVSRFRGSVANFNEVFDSQTRLESQAIRNDFEMTMVILSPFFLVFAIALRLTKVTGEIRIDRNSTSTSSRR